MDEHGRAAIGAHGSGPGNPVNEAAGRSVDRRTVLQVAGLGAAGLWLGGVASGCGGGDESTSDTTTGGGGELPATVKVGVIAPMSGFAQFVGELTERGVQAATQHLADDEVLPGTTVEYQIVDAPIEEGAEGAINGYNQLAADPDIIGVLWATVPGIREAATQIERDRMPVMVTSVDPYSSGWLDGDAMPTVYQFLPPNNWLLEAMCRYAADDRGYATAAFMIDTSVFYYENPRAFFTEIAEAAGLEVVGVEEFTVATMDFGAQLQRLKSAAPQCLHIWGLDENVARIGKGLADLDAGYVDTPTAKSGEGWHPHILGYPGGFGAQWAELAGDAAQPYNISAWYLGGSMQNPDRFPINQWVVDATGAPPAGGEEMPANALWALLEAARQAGSTDRAAISEAAPRSARHLRHPPLRPRPRHARGAHPGRHRTHRLGAPRPVRPTPTRPTCSAATSRTRIRECPPRKDPVPATMPRPTHPRGQHAGPTRVHGLRPRERHRHPVHQDPARRPRRGRRDDRRLQDPLDGDGGEDSCTMRSRSGPPPGWHTPSGTGN